MDEPDDLAKSTILQFLNEKFVEKPDYWFLAPELHLELKQKLESYGYDSIEKTIGLVKIMAESGQLRSKNDAYQISNKGRTHLNTIYNDEWIVKQMEEDFRKKLNKEKKEKKQFDIDERRHQEIVKASKVGKLTKIGVVTAIIVSILSLFGFDDILFNPIIEINPYFADSSDSTTAMYVNIWNHGNSPATNVRITLNPNGPFIKTNLAYSAEDTVLQERGSKSLVAFSPRLSPNERISISTEIMVPLDESHFDIYVTYDQGEKVHYSSTFHGKEPWDEIVITLPEKPSSVEVSVYDPSIGEFVPLEP